MAGQTLLTFGSFVLFTGLVALSTWLLTRKKLADTSEGFFLAGRSLSFGFIAGSLLLTNLSTEQLIGLNGDAFAEGLSVMAWEVVAAVSLVVMALVFLPRYLKSGIVTVPQFLAVRFGQATQTITTLIFIGAYVAITLPMILYTGAAGLFDILDLPSLTGIENRAVVLTGMVWLIGIIGAIYALVGGLRAVAVSDTLNGFGLLVGGLMITWLGLKAVNAEGVFAALAELQAEHPQKFNSLGRSDQSVPFTTLFTGVLLLNLFYWCTNQQIIQRAFAAPSLAEGQKGVLLAGFFKMLAPLILVLPGIIAFHLYAGEGIDRVQAYGTLVKNVLPAPLVGFFAAAVVGAILSSYNSVLNSTATLFSLGVWKGLIRPKASDHESIRVGQYFGIAITLATMLFAPALDQQESIFGYLQAMNAIYFIPIFAVVVVGMFNRHVPGSAANVALLLGVAVIVAKYFVPWDDVSPAIAARLDAVNNFHFLGIVFVSLTLLMLAIGAIRPRETPWVQKDSGEVDLTPWPWAKPAGLVMVLIVIGIYIAFADPSIFADAPAAVAQP